ncbi:MAG TPA: hypothetical protein VH478_01740 [Trebonia sp.]|nr:hypothetical protein [Trebonia sp.]
MRADGFLRHRALILVATGVAVSEAGVVTLVVPGARPLAPQVTALPPVGAYHDLRWLFADSQSWQAFAATMLAVLLAHAALDATLLRLAWPLAGADGLPRPAPPRWPRAFWSCLALTALCWALLTPAVTLTFGVAVLPFSWPLIGALPIMAGVMLAVSHGGSLEAWWRRLPPWRAVALMLASLVVASVASGVITRLNSAGTLAVVAASGLFNARAWYGIAALAARMPARPLAWQPGGMPLAHGPASWLPVRLLLAIPFAPVAALLTVALVVGGARLLFTGAVRLPGGPQTTLDISPATVNADNSSKPQGPGAAAGAGATRAAPKSGAVLVVEGWGSSCCDAANNLRPLETGKVVRQFSYLGLDSRGNPLKSKADDDDLTLPELGDKIEAQLLYLHRMTSGPVDVVAESEGTLGVYAMLARHPTLPVGSVVLLSPIIAPGQISFPRGHQGATDAVPPEALDELNHLVGTMSPYGSAGAEQLLESVSQFGARYFSGVQDGDSGVRWLGVVPLADALSMPACALPPGVQVVPAFHGGLLGDPRVLPEVARFLEGGPAVPVSSDQSGLRAAAEAIAGVAAAWRMPDVSATCPL